MGQHSECAPVLDKHNAVLDTAAAVHLEQLKISKGFVWSPRISQQHILYY